MYKFDYFIKTGECRGYDGLDDSVEDEGYDFTYEVSATNIIEPLVNVIAHDGEIFTDADLRLDQRYDVAKNFVEMADEMNWLDNLVNRYYNELKECFKDEAKREAW